MSAAIGCWVDGAPTNALPADDRGLHYGDGVFETINVRSGRARFLDTHLARLESGCTRLGIPFAEQADLRADIAAAISQAPPRAVLKIIVTRGSSVRRGYAPQSSQTPRRILSLWPAGADPPMAGIRLRVASIRLAVNPVLAGMKHLNRLENVLAAAESAGHDVFESLMLDTAGDLVCGIMTNVFIAHAGRVATPRIDRCGVAGVMRAIVLRECVTLGIPATEERLTLDDLLAADEAFVTNARIGVVPVRRVEEHSFRMNPLASRLAAHIELLDA